MSTETQKRGPIAAEIMGPGPLAYDMKTAIGTKGHTLTKGQAPAYSIGIRPPPRTEPVPGPSYFYDSDITTRGRQRAPAFSLSGRQRSAGIEVTPGPGAYNASDIKSGVLSQEKRSRAISMGQRTRCPVDGKDAPPPNSYMVRTGIGSRALSERFTPAWTMAGRTHFGGTHYDTMKANNPGPGAYGAIEPNVIKQARGKFTISGRTHLKDYSSLKDNPGPGAYNVQWPKCSSSKGCTMGVKHSLYTMPLICDIDVA